MPVVLVRLMALCLLAIGLAGCGPAAGGSAASGTTAPARGANDTRAPGTTPAAVAMASEASGAGRAAQPLQIAVTEPNDMSWIIYGIAIESGIAAEEGFALELQSATTNVAIPAIVNGDLGYTAQVGTAMRAAAQGLPLRVTAIFADAPLQSLLVRPSVREPGDLVGQAVGVSTSGATAHLATVAMLEALGVHEQQVNWVFLGAQPARFAGLDQGLVQAAAITAPLDLQAERDLGYKILVRAADVVHIPFVGIATSTARIRDEPDELRRLIRLGLRSMQFIRERPDEANEVARRWLKLDDRDLVARSMEQVRAVMTRAGAPDRAGFEGELQTIRRLGNLSTVLRASDVADFGPLERVEREMGLPVDAWTD